MQLPIMGLQPPSEATEQLDVALYGDGITVGPSRAVAVEGLLAASGGLRAGKLQEPRDGLPIEAKKRPHDGYKFASERLKA